MSADTPDTRRYCPKLADTAGTRSVQPVFFSVRNRGVEYTRLLAGTIYSIRTSRYGTESIILGLTQEHAQLEDI